MIRRYVIILSLSSFCLLFTGCRIAERAKQMVEQIKSEMKAEVQKMMGELTARIPALVEALAKKQEERARGLMDEFITKVTSIMANPAARGKISQMIGGSIMEAFSKNPGLGALLKDPNALQNLMNNAGRMMAERLESRFKGGLKQELAGIKNEVVGLLQGASGSGATRAGANGGTAAASSSQGGRRSLTGPAGGGVVSEVFSREGASVSGGAPNGRRRFERQAVESALSHEFFSRVSGRKVVGKVITGARAVPLVNHPEVLVLGGR